MKHVTHDYAQPSGYHFCQDSVLFSRFVAEKLDDLPRPERALDVCAGCGVIGFEISVNRPELQQFDFMEVQDAYLESFEDNLELSGHDPQHFRWLQMNYESLLKHEFMGRYDLIVANPPYFYPTDGRLTKSELRNRSRFFLDSNLENLILGIANALSPKGTAYVLMKSGDKHGRQGLRDIRWWLTAAGYQLSAEIVGDIRGTAIVQLSAK